ncbi:MAG: class I tRNA ligase family protein, partial [Pseudoflavonifractor sp.]
LHPFMPFLTEEIWQALPHEGDFLMLQDWPTAHAELCFPEEERAMELIMEAIGAVRVRRSEMNVPPSKRAHLTVVTEQKAIFQLGIPFFTRLAWADGVVITDEVPADTATMVSAVTHEARIFMPMSDLVDLEKEKARMEKELSKSREELSKLNAKLDNPGFVAKAPEAVITAERDRGEKLQALILKLEASVAAL